MSTLARSPASTTVDDATETGVRPRTAALNVSRSQVDVAHLSDARLVDDVARCSHTALAEIYDRHGDEMLKVAQRLRGPASADDVVQDVFLRLWDRPELYDPTRGSLRSFLLMQTRARAIDLLRRDNARRARENVGISDHGAVSTAVDDGALARLAGEHAWLLLSRLSDGERSAIILAYFGDHTYREVALLLGQPVGTIKTRIRSGLGRLRHQMLTSHLRSSPPMAR